MMEHERIIQMELREKQIEIQTNENLLKIKKRAKNQKLKNQLHETKNHRLEMIEQPNHKNKTHQLVGFMVPCGQYQEAHNPH